MQMNISHSPGFQEEVNQFPRSNTYPKLVSSSASFQSDGLLKLLGNTQGSSVPNWAGPCFLASSLYPNRDIAVNIAQFHIRSPHTVSCLDQLTRTPEQMFVAPWLSPIQPMSWLLRLQVMARTRPPAHFTM